VVFARSIPQLGEDLQTARPTILISVPRIYEKIYTTLRAKLDEGPPARKRLFELAVNVGWARFEWQQGRGPWRASLLMWPLFERLVAGKLQERLGGRLRVAISGGAALSADVSRIFIALGVTVLQGYGLTETSPVACANRPGDNLPASVGPPIPGVEVKLGENNALFIRGPNIMMGYWKNEEATRAMIGPDGWLNSGDTARIDARGHVFITGRIKEIIVMSNGEKVPPVDMEAAIMRDSLFDQIMLVGEGKPYLSALAVLNPERWAEYAAELGIDPADPAVLQQKKVMQSVIARIGRQTRDFPGYAQVRRVTLSLEPWTIDNGLLTPTLKLKRAKVMEKFNEELDRMYASLA
jgi:long-chain acyl-CoA synthetase